MTSLNPFLDRVRFVGDPLPDSAAIITNGEARFTVLAPRLLRLEWSPNGAFDDRSSYAFPTRRAAVPRFQTAVEDGTLLLDTGPLRLRYQGGMFGPETLEISLQGDDIATRWQPGAPDTLNLRGARRTLDGCRGEAALEPGLLSRDGWTLFDDSGSVRFDNAGGWVETGRTNVGQDWYFFGYGHDYKAALAEYARFGGAVPMIPRWVLGAWWSRYWAYSEQELRRLVADFATNELPLDVLVLDMDWHKPDGWTGYSWNRVLFPDPTAFLGWLHAQGLHTTLNLHPADGVQPFEDAYADFARAMGGEPSGEPIPFRISDPSFARNYFELLHHPIEEQGADFWWMDWQQGRGSELSGLDPLPWLNHLHYTDMRRRPNVRPMVFSRWGGLGNHRYPIGFSGDTYATWEALRFQPHFTATAANVLYGWWSHDIGGHFGACAPELYARWVQAGALSPILRLHSTNDPVAERRPWTFPPAVAAAARAAFQMRYELLPYLYSLAREHADHALAPCRPTYYEAPEADGAYLAREQYFLGDQILVAPIVQPADPASGLAAADIWLPEGEWIERSTGELLRGPAWVRLVGDLAMVPQLVRAGGILPLASATQRSHTQPADRLTLAVYPGAQGATRVYADVGEGEEHVDGQFEWTPVSLQSSDDGGSCTLKIGPTEGQCDGLPDEMRYTVRFHWVRAPQEVQLDGAAHVQWSYDDVNGTLLIELPPLAKAEQIELTISAGAPLSILGDAHNARLRMADARRLLGVDEPQPAMPTAELLSAWHSSPERNTLLDVALAGTAPGRLDAVARLGGPFAHIYEYTTPEDAARRLGALVIAAPRDGSAVGVAGVWRLTGPHGIDERPWNLGVRSEDTAIECPFAWDGSTATVRWSLEVRLNWRGQILEQQFTAQTLFPTIGAWRLLVRPHDQPLQFADLADAAGNLRQERGWESHTHQPAHGEFQNLTERYNVPLIVHARVDRRASLVGYVATLLHSPDERELRIAYQSFRPLRIWLNGLEVAQEEYTPNQAYQLNETWSRSVPVQLRPGPNNLLIASEHVGEDQAWRWFLHVMAIGSDGLPIPELTTSVP